MRKRLLTLSFVLSTCLLPSLWAEKSLEPVRLQLKWRHQFQFAGYYAAKELGYYRDEGLEVSLIEGSPSIGVEEEVLSRRAQFGVGNSDLVVVRSGGRRVVVLATIFQHSPQILLSLASSGIRSPADLVGRRVMVSKEAETEIFAMLRSEAISPSTLELLPHSWNLEDLVEGRVDAVSAYSTNEALVLASRGIKAVAMRPLSYGIDFYGDLLFTSEVELRSRPERTAAFLRASLKGWQYAMSHVEETINLMLVRYPGKGREALEAEAAAMGDLVLNELIPTGFMNPGRWQFIADTYAALGFMPGHYDLRGFLYTPNTALDPRILVGAGLALGLAALAALAYIIALRAFNRRLALEVGQRTRRLEDLNEELEGQVAQRRLRETELAASLAEKDVLLREIHHRVKNNLQIVASLVSLHLDETASEESRAALMSLRDRVYSMALVHEQLYSGRSLSIIDMEGYLATLLGQIVESYARPGLLVRATARAEGCFLPIEKAIPVGLLAGELVSNSMKHAFAGRDRGRIELELSRRAEGEFLLLLRDDGCGRSSEGEVRRGIGLQLVEALVGQLGGRLEVEFEGGRTTRLGFPAVETGPRAV